MPKTIRALIQSPEPGKMAVAQAPAPIPGRGQVLVEVKVSAVNEMDVQVRAGLWAKNVKAFLKRGPVVTGFEFAGIARSDGGRIKAGDRVIGYVNVLSGPRTHAGQVCVDETDIEVIPQSWSLDDAAALVVMGLTAVEILERLAPVSPGKRVLIIGAAGGVGVYTLQLAKHQGAHVTVVCSERNAAWMKSMGANAVRAYETEPNFKTGDLFDVVVDVPCKESFAASAPFLARGGMYVGTNPLADLGGFVRAAFSSRRAGYLMMLTTTPAKLRRLIELAALGALRPAIDSRFPLSQADQAFDRFETRGKQGRVLLKIED
ncbi:NAD(P)-dependent alcohol dehydrogenase [Phenylobacterium sp.]|uniref:NAD(P)-dependent alcohol dehydrogenase n=1 Tax=Phenylobacterium sp. TaxID=1871053 RepID=UPI0030F38566